MTMRVLHVYAGNLYGGVEAMLAALARRRALAPELEPRFALFFEGRLARELRQAGTPPEILGAVRLSRPWTALRAGFRLARLLERAPVDVVVCHSTWSHAIAARHARRRGVAVVFWLHDAVDAPTRVDRLAMRAPPDLALCCSGFARATLPALFPHAPSEVVYHPVPPPPPGLGSAREEVRRELGTSPGEVAVVQASRMEEWKGHATHLEALARLRDLPWRCWMVGGPQRPAEAAYLAELRALSGRLGIADRVVFTGQRGDVPRLLAAADVLCQPNHGPEPFGIAFVEALYAGLPVVAADSGGAREVVDPSCGVLVPPRDPGALADALRRLIADPELRARLGAAGPARAAALCDPERQMRRLHAVLASVARERA